MDADERRGRRGILTLWAAAGLSVAAAFLSGPLAVACGILCGIATVAGLAAVFAHEPGVDGARQAPQPPETALAPPAEPQPSIRLHVEAPPPVRRWLERVEAEAEATKRSR